MTHDPDLVASAWTLAGDLPFPPGADDRSRFTFEERARAAGAAGFRGMGFTFFDLPRDVADYGYPAMRDILAANGLRHVEIDAIHSWFGEQPEAGLALADTLIEAAGELGAGLVKIVGSLDGQTWPVERMRETFAALAAKAGAAGTRLGLEIMPQSNIMDIETALAVIGDAPHAGMVLDIWHVTRRGIPYDAIRAVPAAMIASIELNDGDAAPRGDLLHDMTNHRKLCGTGAFDIDAYLRAVLATGYGGTYSIEVLSDELRKWPLEKMTAQAWSTTMACFAALA